MPKCLIMTLYVCHPGELGLSEKERVGHSLGLALDLFWRNLMKVVYIQI